MHPFHPDSPVWRSLSAPADPSPPREQQRQDPGPRNAARQYGRPAQRQAPPAGSGRADLPTARPLTPTGVPVAQPIRKGMAILTARPEVKQGRVVRTAKAVLVVIEASGRAARKLWLPLSKVQRIAEDKWKVPRWLLIKEGIA